MVDITITAANVVAGANAVKETGTAGATITAGQAVYRDSNRKYQLADANSATAAARETRGIALHGASDNQPLTIQKEGNITIGATLTAGIAYYLSDTPGGICAVADIASGEYVGLLGVATSTSVIALKPIYSGVAL